VLMVCVARINVYAYYNASSITKPFSSGDTAVRAGTANERIAQGQ
jgi:hypothetical protein